MKTLDLRGQNLKEIPLDQAPEDVEVLQLSNNKIEVLQHEIFLKRKLIFEIDLSRNLLKNISALQCLQCLSILDLRFNSLKLKDLIYLRFSTIGHLKLFGNDFQNDPNYKPMLIPAIIPNAWIIDGIFVTDHIRKMAKSLRDSKSFYYDVMPRGRGDDTEMTLSEKSIFEYCSKIEYETMPSRTHMAPQGAGLVSYSSKTQTERLRFLKKDFNFTLKKGTFIDYFALVLGILTEQWFGESVSIIPRHLSRAYWYEFQEDMPEFVNWKQLLVLQDIVDVIKPETQYEKDLWDALMVTRFLSSGKPPLPGSTSRLILTAFLARAIAQSDVTINQCDDLRIYFKYRRTCGFTSNDDGIEAVFNEILAPFALPSGPIPNIGDRIAIAHPLTGEWNEGKAVAIRLGRIFIKVDDIIVQMPVSALFWDGRGIWRENARKDSLNQSPTSSRRRRTNTRTFLTQSDTDKNEEDKPKEILVELTRPAFKPPPTIPLNIAPDNGMAFVEQSRETMRKSKFIDRTIRKSATFRGIVDPPFASVRPKTARRPPAESTSSQVVDGVVNVVQGKEISEGRFLKKYQVKMVNQMTNRSKYMWINEDDVTEYDVAKLDELYQKHLLSKTMPLSLN